MTFKTPAGTELPILDLRGKPYLQVAHRLVWFREEHPLASIKTEFVTLEPEYAMAKATILTAEGAILATAHKAEDKKAFFDFAEKAETGAVGRALALCGFGTQFCETELDEGQRLADAPVATKVTIKPKESLSVDDRLKSLFKEKKLNESDILKACTRIAGKTAQLSDLNESEKKQLGAYIAKFK